MGQVLPDPPTLPHLDILISFLKLPTQSLFSCKWRPRPAPPISPFIRRFQVSHWLNCCIHPTQSSRPGPRSSCPSSPSMGSLRELHELIVFMGGLREWSARAQVVLPSHSHHPKQKERQSRWIILLSPTLNPLPLMILSLLPLNQMAMTYLLVHGVSSSTIGDL